MKTNIETYQKELADIALYNSSNNMVTSFGVDKRDGVPKECNYFNAVCDNCLFNTSRGCECSTRALKWAYDTIPLLDNVEKKFLKNIVNSIIDKDGEHITHILKERRETPFGDIEKLDLCVGKITRGQLPSFVGGTMYKNLEVGKLYSVEELGLK